MGVLVMRALLFGVDIRARDLELTYTSLNAEEIRGVPHIQPQYKGPKDHLNFKIPQTVVCGILLVLGLGTRM